MKRLGDVLGGLLILLLACLLLGGAAWSMVQFAKDTEGRVVRFNRGKQPTLTVATTDGDENVPFDPDDEPRCPKGARFHKRAWSAERRCDGVPADHGVGAGLGWLGIAIGFVGSALAGWLGASVVWRGLRGTRRPGAPRGG